MCSENLLTTCSLEFVLFCGVAVSACMLPGGVMADGFFSAHFMAFLDFYGTKFDHKTETPGLGAEIKEDFFTVKFEGKTLAEVGPTYFSVLKGGAITNEHSVDGSSAFLSRDDGSQNDGDGDGGDGTTKGRGGRDRSLDA